VTEAAEEVRLAAVGDLLLATDPWGKASPRDPRDVFGPIGATFAECDIVIGNLECTLPGTGEMVTTEPRVFATPDLVRGIREARINVVSLANNHVFDAYDAGFHRLRRTLDEIGVRYFGAGDTPEEAAAPAVMTLGGLRLGFLGAADRRSGPGGFAAQGRGGVAPLDMPDMADRVRRLRREVDHVIVSLHWGDERLPAPSPGQIEVAHRLATAGASLVLGHHPHRIQGMETYCGAAIAYSLGNFVASEVPFTDGDRVTWNRVERTGGVLRATLARGEVRDVAMTASYDDGRAIRADTSGFAGRLIARANRRLARGVTPGSYAWEYFVVTRLSPLLRKLRWSRLKKLRRKLAGGAPGDRGDAPPAT